MYIVLILIPLLLGRGWGEVNLPNYLCLFYKNLRFRKKKLNIIRSRFGRV